jgi:hypothetical protein
MAENDVDFQPLHPEVFPGLTRRPAFKREDLETESGLGAASGRLEIRPEHQHKTVNTRQPSLTFISPPSEEELRVHSSLLQVRLYSTAYTMCILQVQQKGIIKSAKYLQRYSV